MSRQQHDVVNDHFGVLSDAQIADGTPASGDVPINNGDGTSSWGPQSGGGFDPFIASAECNTSPATSGSPNTATLVPMDTFYDSDGNSEAWPAGTGLSEATSFSGTNFTATEDGVWIVTGGVDLEAAPGSTGTIYLSVDDLGYNPRYNVLASGNPDNWQFERTIFMRAGGTVSLRQSSAGTAVVQLTYAFMTFTRLADSYT